MLFFLKIFITTEYFSYKMMEVEAKEAHPIQEETIPEVIGESVFSGEHYFFSRPLSFFAPIFSYVNREYELTSTLSVDTKIMISAWERFVSPDKEGIYHQGVTTKSVIDFCGGLSAKYKKEIPPLFHYYEAVDQFVNTRIRENQVDETVLSLLLAWKDCEAVLPNYLQGKNYRTVKEKVDLILKEKMRNFQEKAIIYSCTKKCQEEEENIFVLPKGSLNKIYSSVAPKVRLEVTPSDISLGKIDVSWQLVSVGEDGTKRVICESKEILKTEKLNPGFRYVSPSNGFVEELKFSKLSAGRYQFRVISQKVQPWVVLGTDGEINDIGNLESIMNLKIEQFIT